MQTPESLKLNPINVVQPQAQADYGPKKLIVLENSGVSLAGAALTQNFVLGGHIDRDPLYTSFAPDGAHQNVVISGANATEVTFIGHYPGLNADASDDAHPTRIHNSQFILVGEQQRGYKFQVIQTIAQPVTQYSPDTVGQGPNLSGSSFKQADLSGTDFTGCNLQGSSFIAADLKGCNFTGANLAKCNFNGADVSGASFIGANLAGCDLSSTITAKNSNFNHSYLVGAKFHCLRGENFAYRGDFQGAIFADGDRRIEVSNTNFSQISGLINGQFVCYYKSNVVLPKGVDCISTNRFTEAREAAPKANAPKETAAGQTAWGDGYIN
ncbi:MAG: pentapeptide repeat-containing protein [Cyanobacteria bacterium P01_D01_bin.156]